MREFSRRKELEGGGISSCVTLDMPRRFFHASLPHFALHAPRAFTMKR